MRDMGSKPSRSDVSKIVGQRVREIRTARGMSLAQLSPQVGIGLAQLSNLELGKRRVSVDDLHAFTRTFGVSATSLMGDLWA